MQRNGLYQGEIRPSIDRENEHQQVSLTFEVHSGKRARLTTPTITGDTKLAPDVVAKAAKYKRFFRWKQATAENQQSGVQNVRKRYSKDDRLTANVVVGHVDYDPSTNTVKPAISADGGPKVQVKANGAKVSKGTLKKYVPVFDEETLNRDLLVRGVANLRDYFQNRGYFDVDVDFQNRTVSADQEESLTRSPWVNATRWLRSKSAGTTISPPRRSVSVCSCSPPARFACVMAASVRALRSATNKPSQPCIATTDSATAR